MVMAFSFVPEICKLDYHSLPYTFFHALRASYALNSTLNFTELIAGLMKYRINGLENLKNAAVLVNV